MAGFTCIGAYAKLSLTRGSSFGFQLPCSEFELVTAFLTPFVAAVRASMLKPLTLLPFLTLFSLSLSNACKEPSLPVCDKLVFGRAEYIVDQDLPFAPASVMIASTYKEIVSSISGEKKFRQPSFTWIDLHANGMCH